jgi:hypothetical protein
MLMRGIRTGMIDMRHEIVMVMMIDRLIMRKDLMNLIRHDAKAFNSCSKAKLAA